MLDLVQLNLVQPGLQHMEAALPGAAEQGVAKPGAGEPGPALSCVVAPLGAESSSGSLGAGEPRWGFQRRGAILRAFQTG